MKKTHYVRIPSRINGNYYFNTLTSSTSEDSVWPPQRGSAVRRPDLLFCIFLSLISLVGFSPSASAALIANDSFTYPIGLSLEGQFGGAGWLSGWMNSTGATAVATGLGYTDAEGNILLGGAAVKAFFDGSGGPAESLRTMISARGATNDTTTWISFVAVRTGPTTNSSANIYPAGAGVSLVDTLTTPGTPTERLAIGNATGAAANNWALIPNGNGANSQSSTNPFSQLSFVVIRVDHKAGNDDAYLWINPSLTNEPSIGSADASSVGMFDFTFDAVRPFAAAAGADYPHAELAVDEIRVGDAYADVAPIGSSLLIYEDFSYDPNVPIGYQGSGNLGWTNELGEVTFWNDLSFAATVERGSLLYRDSEGNTLVTYGNKVHLTGAGGANTVTRDALLLRGADGSTTWLSFLVARVGPSGGGANPFPAGAYLLLSNTNLSSSQAQLAMGNTANAAASTVALIPDANAANSQSSTNAFGPDVSCVLVRIDHKSGGDDAYMWVNPVLSTEPSTASASAQSLGTFDFSFNSITLFAQEAVGGNHAELLVDEIRVGVSFASVTPHVPEMIAYEGFDYPDTVTNLNGQTGGIGFSAPWASDSGNPPAAILSGSLAYTDSNGNSLMTTGNRAEISGANGTAQPRRDLSAFVGTDGTTTWWSFLGIRKGPTYQPDGLPPKFRRVASLQIHTTNPGSSTAERLAIGRGTENSGTVHDLDPQPWDTWGFYDVASTTRGVYSTNAWDELAFLVVRIDHHGGNSTDAANQPDDIDEAWLWVNPDLDQEPSTNTALALGTSYTNVNTMAQVFRSDLSFNRIKSFVGGNQQTLPDDNHGEWEVDEIRIAQSFALVAPIAGSMPTISISGNSINWSGSELQSSLSVTGIWSKVEGAVPPTYTIVNDSDAKFYRSKQ